MVIFDRDLRCSLWAFPGSITLPCLLARRRDRLDGIDNRFYYYIPSAVSGQDEPNLAL